MDGQGGPLRVPLGAGAIHPEEPGKRPLQARCRGPRLPLFDPLHLPDAEQLREPSKAMRLGLPNRLDGLVPLVPRSHIATALPPN